MKKYSLILILFCIAQWVSAGGGAGWSHYPAQGGEPIATYFYDGIGRIHHMVMSPQRGVLLLLTAHGIWRAEVEDLSALPQHIVQDNRVTTLAFHPDGTTFAYGLMNGMVIIADSITGAQINALHVDNQVIYALAFHPDGHILAVGDGAGVLRLWDTQTGDIIEQPAHQYYLSALAYSPDGEYLVSSGIQREELIKIWDGVMGDYRATPELVIDNLSDPARLMIDKLVFMPDKNRIVSVTHAEMLKSIVLSLSDGVGLYYQAMDIAVSPDGLLVATAQSVGQALLHDVETFKPYAVIGSLPVDENAYSPLPIYNISFLADNITVLTVSVGNRLDLWDVRQAELLPEDA